MKKISELRISDIHTHALSGIDDGARSIQESIDMLKDSKLQGVDVCALTPHCCIHDENAISDFLETRQNCFDLLSGAIDEDSVPKLVLGAEVYADHDISIHHDIEKLCIGNSGYLLVELPYQTNYNWLSECVYALNLKGITPILAHIDRYPLRDEIIACLDGLLVIYQLNTSQFLRFFGRRIIKKLLRYKKPFILSTDMHNTTTRKCNISQALKNIKKVSKKPEDDFLWDIDII